MENWSKIQSPDTLYIMPNSPDLEFCSFSHSHQGSPLNPKVCASYLNVICTRPWKPLGTLEVQKLARNSLIPEATSHESPGSSCGS